MTGAHSFPSWAAEFALFRRILICPGPSLGGGTLALCQGPCAPKGPHATAVVAATDDGWIDQSNQISSP